MNMIKEQVQEAIKTAMRAQQKEKLAVLRLILAEIKRVEIDERIALDVNRELAVLDKMQKQRRESLEQFQRAGRVDLVAQEQFEIEIIQLFKPPALSAQEIHDLVIDAIKVSQATSIKEMNKVMMILKPQLQGRADLGQVSANVKALLS